MEASQSERFNLSPDDRIDWRLEESLGLYVLYLNDERSQLTSIVDRKATRGEQVDQLLAAEWLPPYVIADWYDLIIAGLHPWDTGWFGLIPSGRLHLPMLVRSISVEVADQGETTHEVRRALWPTLTDQGAVELEPGESVVSRTSLSYGPDAWRNASIDHEKSGNRLFPRHSRECQIMVTNRRIIWYGEYIPPRQHANSAERIVSPSLAIVLAERKTRQRRPAVGGIRTIAHVRLEWLAAAITDLRVEPKKSPFGKSWELVDASVTPVIHEPSGFTGVRASLARPNRSDPTRWLKDLSLALDQSDLGLTTGSSEEVVKTFTKGFPRTYTVMSIEGGMPRSIADPRPTP